MYLPALEFLIMRTAFCTYPAPQVRGRARHVAAVSLQLCGFTFKTKRAKGSKQNATPTKHVVLPLNMECVPIEIWQQIPLETMEIGAGPIFATSCTPYIFLYIFLSRLPRTAQTSSSSLSITQ